MSAETLPAPVAKDPRTLPGPRGPWAAAKTIYKYFTDSEGLHHYLDSYGETIFVDSVFGPVLYTADPAVVKKLWATGTSAFISFSDHYKCLLGHSSVVLMEGENHLARRKLIMPMFHGEAIRSYQQVMRNAAQQRTAQWVPGQTYRMQTEMGDISLKTIIGTVLGAIEPERVKAYTEILAELGDSVWAPGLYIKAFRQKPFGLGPWARFERNVEAFHKLVWEDMRKRREHGLRTNDVLTELLYAKYEDGSELPYESVRDELSGLLMAGYDTVSVTLTWALHDLHMNPEVLAKVRQELDSLPEEPTLEQVMGLPYLEGAINETLRLHPASFETTRRTAKPMEIDGYLLPENTGIVIGILPIHLRPDIYPEPTRYMPERWIGKKYGSHEFLTFGGGTRRCVGSSLTSLAMKLSLLEVLRNWELELLDRGPVRAVRGDPGLKAETGIPMKVVGRRQWTPTEATQTVPAATPAAPSGCPFSGRAG